MIAAAGIDPSIAVAGAIITAFGAAVYKLLKLVLDSMSQQRTQSDNQHLEAMSEMEQRFEKFLDNHMSRQTAAQEHLARVVEELARKIEKQGVRR